MPSTKGPVLKMCKVLGMKNSNRILVCQFADGQMLQGSTKNASEALCSKETQSLLVIQAETLTRQPKCNNSNWSG